MKNFFPAAIFATMLFCLMGEGHAGKNAIESISIKQKSQNGTADSGISNSKAVEADSAGSAGIAIDEPGVHKSRQESIPGTGSAAERLLPTVNKKTGATAAKLGCTIPPNCPPGSSILDDCTCVPSGNAASDAQMHHSRPSSLSANDSAQGGAAASSVAPPIQGSGKKGAGTDSMQRSP